MKGIRLRAKRIAETAVLLSQRIRERFPDSGLCRVSTRLLELGDKARINAPTIGRPIYGVRIAGAALILLVMSFAVVLVWTVMSQADELSRAALPELLEGLEAGTNLVVLVGLAIYFLISLETRIKRARALRAIHELRSIAHVIDMHQLTKDPHYYRGDTESTEHSPKRELSLPELMRYLDYCSEMLSITSKIAALYIQYFSDSVVLDAVSDVEHLCDGLSRKVWQKMNIAQDISDRRISPVN